MADRLGAPRERIAAFKRLAVQAAAHVANGADGYGVLLDGEHGREALFDAAETDLWIARPVERPGSRPLALITPDLGSHLVEWPLDQTVKCLCFYHPDDAAELKERQEAALLTVYDACRSTGRELLVEIIAGKHGPVADTTVAAVLERLYALGIKPDWWKLEPQGSAAAWRAVETAIRTGDPHCRGVVLLGLDAPEDTLIAGFAPGGGASDREGLRHRPHHLLAGRRAMAAGRHLRRRGDRRHGGTLQAAVGGLGSCGGAGQEGGIE